MLSEDEDLEVLAKIVLCGDSGVGKTNLLMRYLLGTYQPETKATIGVDFFAKNVVLDDKNVKIQFFDTAGQEKYRSICSTYFKNVNGIILVYDITDRKSFDSLSEWLETIYRYASDEIVIMLIGNKKDLEEERNITKDEAETYASEKGMFFMETSALRNKDKQVNKAFEIITKEVVKELERIEKIKNEAEYDKILKRSLRYNILKKRDGQSRCPC